jgi:hypothetical protein
LELEMPPSQAIPGAFIESAGVKTAAMSFSDYSNQFALEQFGMKFGELEGYQKDIIQQRIETAMETGEIAKRQPPDKYWREIEAILAEEDQGMVSLERAILTNRVTENQAIDMYFKIKDAARNKREQTEKIYGYEYAERDPDEPDLNKKKLEGYYDLTKLASINGVFNAGLYSELREIYEDPGSGILTEEQLKYIYRNTNRRPVSDVIMGILPDKTRARILSSQEARELATR